MHGILKNLFCIGTLNSALLIVSFSHVLYADDSRPLPGTQPLTMDGDIASQLVDGVDKFLLKQIEASVDVDHSGLLR